MRVRISFVDGFLVVLLWMEEILHHLIEPQYY